MLMESDKVAHARAALTAAMRQLHANNDSIKVRVAALAPGAYLRLNSQPTCRTPSQAVCERHVRSRAPFQAPPGPHAFRANDLHWLSLFAALGISV